MSETRRPMHRHGPGMVPGEKAKDFRGTIGKLLAYMGNFKFALLGVILAFFGGELLLMCLKTVLNGNKRKDDTND